MRAGGLQTHAGQADQGDGFIKRLHVHVTVSDLQRAVGFYSGLFDTEPCCAGTTYANWRVDEPPLNFGASVSRRPGFAHLGLEVDAPADLRPVDRVLHDHRGSAAVPWEVAVRRQIVHKERTP